MTFPYFLLWCPIACPLSAWQWGDVVSCRPEHPAGQTVLLKIGPWPTANPARSLTACLVVVYCRARSAEFCRRSSSTGYWSSKHRPALRTKRSAEQWSMPTITILLTTEQHQFRWPWVTFEVIHLSQTCKGRDFSCSYLAFDKTSLTHRVARTLYDGYASCYLRAS